MPTRSRRTCSNCATSASVSPSTISVRGYSTLSYVKHFPVDRLKIDQCFVRDIATNPSDAAIVRAIVSLGHSLDLEIVAEGVETLQQTTLLRAEGCDEVQGFYFGGPMVAEDLMAFVRENRASARIA